MLANKKKRKRKIHIKFNPLQENLTVMEQKGESKKRERERERREQLYVK